MTSRASTLLLTATLAIATAPAFAHGSHELVAPVGQILSFFLPSVVVAGALIATTFALPARARSARD